MIKELKPEEQERLQGLCVARGEDAATVLARFGHDGLMKIPRGFSRHMSSLRKTKFVRAETRDGLAFVELQNGRVFYGYTSKPNHRKAYQYVKDVISDLLTEDTYLLALDIAHRYTSDITWPPVSIQPPKGGVIVECGAFLGHKTIRFVDELVGPKGKVLAIEMMPDNTEILRLNVKENGLDDVIDILETGVWKEADVLPVKGKGRQRNILLELDKLTDNRDVSVRVDSLDVLLKEWGQSVIDLLFLTINGAEVEAMEGLVGSSGLVKAMFIEAHYQRDGRSKVDICKELVRLKGYRILDESDGTRLFVDKPLVL